MNFKIDTKEKFSVLTPVESQMSDILTEELIKSAKELLHQDKRNIVLNLKNVTHIDEAAATHLVALQQSFYENNTSFVICEMQPSVEAELEDLELFEIMNVTPTESEAWDIVQMEEIERELFDGHEDA